MELTSFFGRTAKRITTHYNPKTNAGTVVFIEFEEGAQVMVAVSDLFPGPTLEEHVVMHDVGEVDP